MKVGWVTKKLGDVTTKIGSGATPRGGEESYKTTGISLIRSLNVYDYGFREAKLARIDDEQAARLSNVIVEADDVLLNITGASVARCCLAPIDFLPARVNQHVSIIRPVKGKFVPVFLHYLLISETYKDRLLFTGEEGGSTRQAITKAQLQDFTIEFPESLPEQQRIVTILDEAFDGIATAKANAEKNLQNARALFESHLQSVFTQRGEGWVVKTIKEITSHLGDGLHGTPKYTDAGEYYFVNGNNLDDGKIVFKENTKRVSVIEYEKYKKKLTDRTVLVSINGTLGNVAFYNDEKIILGKSACYFNILDCVDKHFIKYIISSPYFIEYAHREATGATIKNVSLKSMREFKVPLPPLNEQNTIVCKLDGLSKETKRLEAIYQQKLAALDALKKSLLDQAFTGQL